MKIVLILVMCSFTTGDCIPPYTLEKEFNDMYDCLLNGYEMARDKTIEIGRDRSQ